MTLAARCRALGRTLLIGLFTPRPWVLTYHEMMLIEETKALVDGLEKFKAQRK